jgi:hypothetical protein
MMSLPEAMYVVLKNARGVWLVIQRVSEDSFWVAELESLCALTQQDGL